MKVIKYSEFNSSQISDDGYMEMLEQLDLTYLDWKYNQNLSEGEINEGLSDIFSSLIGTLGNGITFKLKTYAADWLLQKLGLPTNNSFLSKWAENVVGMISFKHIGDYFGEGSCPYWSKAILKGLEITIADIGIDKVLGAVVGVQINFNEGFIGTLNGSMKAGGELALLNTDLNNKLVDALEGKICGKGTSFTEVFGGGKITPDQIKKAAAAEQSGDKGDDTGKSSGILSLLGIK